jgi:cytochrome P450
MDMLDEMRRIALLVLMGTLYQTNFDPVIDQLWNAVLKTIQYISPGLWILWNQVPRPGYAKALREIDDYLYQIIRVRRANPIDGDDLLSLLVRRSDMDDDLIRDQLLTMLIAGHDTSTALLSWVLYLLGKHPEAMSQLEAEVMRTDDQAPVTIESLTKLSFMDQVIDETLRLYPPIHLGSRLTADDIEFQGYRLPRNTRVMYSIYLTHRLPQYWDNPSAFRPERFAIRPLPYTYLPFGGGPRNCIGAAYAQAEAKIILMRILQRYHLELLPRPVHAHMGATLEPRPGVWMRVQKRKRLTSVF